MFMNSTDHRFGTLKCRVVDALRENVRPRFLIVLNHGFGAPADDLVDFGPMLIDESDAIAESCRFVFPAAPIDLGPMGMPGGRAWWPINMARLAEIHQTQNFEQLTDVEPPGMSEAGGLLTAAIREMQHEWKLGDSQLVLGGFSQGAMVSTHVMLSAPFTPALLTLFSGTLLWKAQWSRLAASHPGTAVLQSHGTQDPILPFAAAVQLRQLLTEAKFNVEFIEFSGQHTIPMQVLQRLRRRIETCVTMPPAAERDQLPGP